MIKFWSRKQKKKILVRCLIRENKIQFKFIYLQKKFHLIYKNKKQNYINLTAKITWKIIPFKR